MSDNAPTRTASDVLRDLHEYLAPEEVDVDSMSPQAIRAELMRHGIDSVQSFAAMREWLGDEIAAVELDAARKARVDALQAIPTPKSFSGGLCEKIHKLLSGLEPKLASAYFSKFEKASEEDLQSLYDDLMALNEQEPPRP